MTTRQRERASADNESDEQTDTTDIEQPHRSVGHLKKYGKIIRSFATQTGIPRCVRKTMSVKDQPRLEYATLAQQRKKMRAEQNAQPSKAGDESLNHYFICSHTTIANTKRTRPLGNDRILPKWK